MQDLLEHVARTSDLPRSLRAEADYVLALLAHTGKAWSSESGSDLDDFDITPSQNAAVSWASVHPGTQADREAVSR